MKRTKRHLHPFSWYANASTLLIPITVLGALGHRPQATTLTQPTFEVASIKVANNQGVRQNVIVGGGGCRGTDAASGAIPLGHCVLHNVTLKFIINLAYNFETIMRTRQNADGRQLDQLIVTGPDWANPIDVQSADRFEIDAKVEDPARATSAQLFEMLRALLAERFKLVVHTDNRESSGLVLTVAKGGPKLHENALAGVPGNLGGPLEGGFLTGRNVAIPALVQYLSRRLDRPVVDKTGLMGSYDISLKWTPGDDEIGVKRGGAADNNGPSLYKALGEQLGLHLESQKVSNQVIVIDHVEKPTLN